MLVYTALDKETSAYHRLMHSAQVNGLNLRVLGLGSVWEGNAKKIGLLKNELENYWEDESKVVLFVDGFDTLINAVENEILSRFRQMNARVLFSATVYCFPDTSVAHT